MAARAGAWSPTATLDWLEAYRFSGQHPGLSRGRAVLPRLPRARRRGAVRRGRAARDARAERAQLRLGGRERRRPDGRGRRRAPDRRDGVAPHRGALRGRRGARRVPRRVSRRPATSRPAAPGAFRRWAPPRTRSRSCFDREEDAFRAQVDAMGVGTTLLVDTYEIPDAVESAVRVAGAALGAVRIDSGDLAVRRRARCVRSWTVSAPPARGSSRPTTSTSSRSKRCGRHRSTRSASAPRVVTGSGAPAAGFVYKLAAHLDDERQLDAGGKAIGGEGDSRGPQAAGAGTARRRRRGRAHLRRGAAGPTGSAASCSSTWSSTVNPSAWALGPEGVLAARIHHAAAIAELPRESLALEPGEPAIPTVYF